MKQAQTLGLLWFLSTLQSIWSQITTQQNFSVLESVAVGTSIGKVSCDGPAAQYDLNDQTFSIKQDGTIQVASSLDRESVGSYKFEVKGAHSGQLACRISVTVDVLDANDNAPMFTSDYYHLELPHHVTTGTIIGGVKAMDFDLGLNGEVTYSFQSNSQAFTVDSSSGVITVKNPTAIPAEAVQLTVVAKDKGNPPRTTTSFIHIMPPGTHDMPMN